MKLQLTDGWRFCLTDARNSCLTGCDFWARDYDDSAWKEVQVPYDWAVTFPFEQKNSSGTAYLPGGTGWFRCHFVLDKDCSGKQAEVCFDGVYKHCKVWCNGYYLGNWQNGFTSFSFDLTEALRTDGSENVLAVLVEHEDIADCRWYTGSGIMRPVFIHFSDDVRVEQGSARFSADAQGSFCATAVLCCAETGSREVSVRVSLADEGGRTVFSAEKRVPVESHQTIPVAVDGHIDGVAQWSPEHPALYSLSYAVLDGDRELDSYAAKVGFRSLRFDADKGFFCNGVNMKLKGVCVHEDAGCFGNAVPKDVWRRRLEKLRDAGCNAIRMSHNPHSSELYDLCDELGFFVMDEIYDEWQNPKNKWVRGHNVYPPSHQGITEDFVSCWKQDVRSFVERSRNHPSVIMYSIGNEIDYPNDPYCSPKFREMTGNNDADKPAAEKMYNTNHPDISQLERLAAMLAAEVRKYDASRPVTMALAFPELSVSTGVLRWLDVAGYNYKEQFYEQDHKAYPRLPFVGSENSHSLEAWRYVADNDYVMGQFLWTGIDYLGEAKGWPVHGSPAGLLTLAGFEKPSFYFRKALWTEQKFAKLFTAPAGTEDWTCSWNYAAGEEVDVMVYANVPELSLLLNGAPAVQLHVGGNGSAGCRLRFEPGLLTVNEGAACLDQLSTVSAACGIQAHPVCGTTLCQIEVSLVDAEGQLAATDGSLVSAAVTGGGELAGLENGDLADVTEYASSCRHAVQGRLMVYVRKSGDGGAVQVTLSSPGKKAAVVEFTF